MQQLVLAEIRRAGQAGVPLERLERLLADYRELHRLDPPKDPQLCVRVTIHQINHALLAANQPRIADGRAGDRRYRLEYDADTDIRESVRVGFEVIRVRVRSGGRGWGESR
jgi:hypothetical protein